MIYTDPSGHALNKIEVETYIDLSRNVGAYGNTGDDWWKIRSIMGVEAKKGWQGQLDDNNQFKYLYNMATLNHYEENENTIGNAEWAKAELVKLFEKAASDEAIDVLGIGLISPGGRISKATSLIKGEVRLVKAAEEMGKNPAVQREADELVAKFLRGNINPGLGTKNLFRDISYLRGDSGARVFYRIQNGEMQILAKANKANEQTVINILKKVYGK